MCTEPCLLSANVTQADGLPQLLSFKQCKQPSYQLLQQVAVTPERPECTLAVPLETYDSKCASQLIGCTP